MLKSTVDQGAFYIEEVPYFIERTGMTSKIWLVTSVCLQCLQD